VITEEEVIMGVEEIMEAEEVEMADILMAEEGDSVVTNTLVIHLFSVINTLGENLTRENSITEISIQGIHIKEILMLGTLMLAEYVILTEILIQVVDFVNEAHLVITNIQDHHLQRIRMLQKEEGLPMEVAHKTVRHMQHKVKKQTLTLPNSNQTLIPPKMLLQHPTQHNSQQELLHLRILHRQLQPLMRHSQLQPLMQPRWRQRLTQASQQQHPMQHSLQQVLMHLSLHQQPMHLKQLQLPMHLKRLQLPMHLKRLQLPMQLNLQRHHM